MQKKMKEANLPEPVFLNEREDFVVTFYKCTEDKWNLKFEKF